MDWDNSTWEVAAQIAASRQRQNSDASLPHTPPGRQLSKTTTLTVARKFTDTGGFCRRFWAHRRTAAHGTGLSAAIRHKVDLESWTLAAALKSLPASPSAPNMERLESLKFTRGRHCSRKPNDNRAYTPEIGFKAKVGHSSR